MRKEEGGGLALDRRRVVTGGRVKCGFSDRAWASSGQAAYI